MTTNFFVCNHGTLIGCLKGKKFFLLKIDWMVFVLPEWGLPTMTKNFCGLQFILQSSNKMEYELLIKIKHYSFFYFFWC
jgi:hypothetical protein